MNDRPSLVFVTGTRADFSKMAPLIRVAKESQSFEVGVFITGMHMLKKYGSTYLEVEGLGDWDFKFINQTNSDTEPRILAKTVEGFADFAAEYTPDLVIIHGDRLESVAVAMVCAMTNTRLAHVEGGEVSGTIDDSYRHAISKLAHLHFVSNEAASNRLRQLGESRDRIFTIGSPELDLMSKKDLPTIEEVLARYEIPWRNYAIGILHPVTTESGMSADQAKIFCSALERSNLNYVIIESNNDKGSDAVRNEISKLSSHGRFRVLPSMRYEFFLSLLRESQFLIGNSSTGVREAPHYGIPSVNVGSRQTGRASAKSIYDAKFTEEALISAIDRALKSPREPTQLFGDGRSSERFISILQQPHIWKLPIQKRFSDLSLASLGEDYH